MSFTARLSVAFAAGLIVAALLAPVAAAIVFDAGWRIPFPRIFDRVVMISVFTAIGFGARTMRVWPLLGSGFANPAENLVRAGRGFIAAVFAIVALAMVALAMGGKPSPMGEIVARIPSYLAAAIVIAIIEEGFFR
ncbi:MAG TPA: hypothetical protein VMT58_04475, partial [Candidatus Binataceae bacterium]|nr:hypothetical protein [Candidatus Binataceae bacterium]